MEGLQGYITATHSCKKLSKSFVVKSSPSESVTLSRLPMSSPPRYTSNAGRAFSDWSGVRREKNERRGKGESKGRSERRGQVEEETERERERGEEVRE